MVVVGLSKIISFYGPPNSGKTILSYKTSLKLANNTKESVILISPDIKVPTLGYLFPNSNEKTLHSMGEILDRTDISVEDISRQLNCSKNIKNMAVLGYKTGENRFSYPIPTKDKIRQLIDSLEKLASYIVVDCGDITSCDISYELIEKSEYIITIRNPNIKCMEYYLSNGGDMISKSGQIISVMNKTSNTCFSPDKEITKYFEDIKITFPFSSAISIQVMNGSLSEGVGDRGFNKSIDKLIQAVI